MLHFLQPLHKVNLFNHMAATDHIYLSRHGKDDILKFKPTSEQRGQELK